jgi:hypothetical protein
MRCERLATSKQPPRSINAHTTLIWACSAELSGVRIYDFDQSRPAEQCAIINRIA